MCNIKKHTENVEFLLVQFPQLHMLNGDIEVLHTQAPYACWQAPKAAAKCSPITQSPTAHPLPNKSLCGGYMTLTTDSML